MITTIQNAAAKKYCEDSNGKLFVLPKRKNMIIPDFKYNPIRPKAKEKIIVPEITYNPIHLREI